MEVLALHTGALTVNWEDNTSCISVVCAKRVTPRVQHIDIPVFFLQDQLDNGLFLPKYEKSSVMLAYKCTKPFSCPIISRITKWMTGFRLDPTSETENYQFMILNEFYWDFYNQSRNTLPNYFSKKYQ